MSTPEVRHQSEYVPLTREQFRERFFARFYDPAFDSVRNELEKVCDKAYEGYRERHGGADPLGPTPPARCGAHAAEAKAGGG